MSWFLGTTHKLHVYFDRITDLRLYEGKNAETLNTRLDEFSGEIIERMDVISEELQRLERIKERSSVMRNKLQVLSGHLSGIRIALGIWKERPKRVSHKDFVFILTKLHEVSSVAHELHNLFSSVEKDHKLLRYEEAKIES